MLKKDCASSKPQLHFTGPVAKWAEDLNVQVICPTLLSPPSLPVFFMNITTTQDSAVSVSHDGDYAMAQVILITGLKNSSKF
jgi:phosphopantetheinyl transferase (holo-ACP synthase)